MSSVNKVILLGRLGKDPETKFTPSGMQITTFSLATSEKVKRGENWEEKTEWHNIVTFNKTAQIVADYYKKGNQIYLEGKISTNSWEDENGQKRYKTEIIANNTKNLTPKNDAGQNQGYSQNSNQGYNNQPANNPEDDLPF